MAVIITSIGDLVRFHRSLASMSQEDLAEKIGVARVTITSIESGKRDPSIGMLEKIAIGLGGRLEVNFTPNVSMPVVLPRG